MSRLLSIALALLLSVSLNSKELIVKSKGPKNPAPFSQAKLMDCDPPISYTEFSLNNIRFGLESAGQIWENNGNASYEVPKVDPSSNEIPTHSLYAGALWVGGYSPDGQLKLAAVTYRTGGGTDFYNGPLSNNNFATADLCDDYDTHFPEENLIATTFDGNGNATAFRVAGARRLDAQIHKAYHDALADGTADVLFPDGYTMPDYFNDWPGNNFNESFDFFLAPYFDYDGDGGAYSPEDGDFPWFDLDNNVDCKTRSVTDPIPLFGDEAMWWVFNDNGGVHTETGGQPIGLEIQAQAFAYTTTNEINNMSFYNYVIINRGTQILQDCYFGQWVDPDLGCPTDDYVGCDVQRGLGYCYNGDDNDEDCTGVPGYGLNPPAVGIDFFEGPYQDPDGINNPLSTDLDLVNSQLGIPYGGIGIGYTDATAAIPDAVVDNERFGMRRFVYYNRDDQTPTPNINGEPSIAIEFYNYLDGIWKNGELMTYGGNGVGGSIPTDYMFPGTTDPVGFATDGAVTDGNWTEDEEGNQSGDRRFIQSAGKFTLEPGEFNNVTVGAVWARPFGGVDQTLNALRIADDKAQSLFDNCFRILSGPDAPDVDVVELDQEIILLISNDNAASNNFNETYGFGQPQEFAFDPLIPGIDCDGNEIPFEEKFYEFQGYKVYQLKNSLVSSAELDNPDLARLQFQCDIQDGIAQIVNYEDDPTLGQKVAVEKVDGADAGIQHSFRVTEDLFSTESTTLVNHKQYYFMVVAYAYNEWSPYNGLLIGDACGQPLPYIESRKSASGGIAVKTAMPHKQALQNGGTQVNSSYGDEVAITRIEGEGNGGNFVNLKQETIDSILASPSNLINELDYVAGEGPISVRIVNPLKVRDTNFKLYFTPTNDLADAVNDWEIDGPEQMGWVLIDEAYPDDPIVSSTTIDTGGEQIIKNSVNLGGGSNVELDYGISISIQQYEYDNSNIIAPRPDVIGSSIEYEDSEFENWLIGVNDFDGPTEQNWIRSGSNYSDDDPNPCVAGDPFADECYYFDYTNRDESQVFESILGGAVGPWHVASQGWSGPAPSEANWQGASSTELTDLNSVDIVLVDEKENWTRVPVLEMQNEPNQAEGLAEKLHSRIALSVDKNGLNQLNGGDYDECTYFGQQVLTAANLEDFSNGDIERHKIVAFPGQDPDDIDDSQLIGLSFGMGWFPGYAIDVETGERLCMAFGEDSWLGFENGRDMIFNPTSTMFNSFELFPFFNPSNVRFGGMHYIYTFRNQRRQDVRDDRMPHYDGANFMYHNINEGATQRKRIFRACTWIAFPLLNDGFEFKSVEDGLIPTKTTIKVRVTKPYARMATIDGMQSDYLLDDPSEPGNGNFDYFAWEEDNNGVFDPEDFDPTMFPNADGPVIEQSVNNWLPLYGFSTEGLGAVSNSTSTLAASLEDSPINVVPNPYYGGSDYENSGLSNLVKIINLPNRANIKIYNTSGTLVRNVVKDDNSTEYVWDLRNERNVPISGGVYIFHIEIPGVTEKVVKWFGAMRPIDLDNF